MANDEDLARLRQGAAVWNDWLARNHTRGPRRVDLRGADLGGATIAGADLRGADLRGADLRGAYFRDADLQQANLQGADLGEANLNRANLEEANLQGADLYKADLTAARLFRVSLIKAHLFRAKLPGARLFKANLYKADFTGADLGEEADLREANLQEANLRHANLHKARLNRADLRGADLRWADLSEANLSGAALQLATLIKTNLRGADLTGCRIYGISAWDTKLEGAKQGDLVITDSGQPEVTVDNLEVAQFIYLLLHNEKIREVIDTIGRKGVLLLGRFTEGRVAILERLRAELRNRGWVPMVFNFDKPETKDFTETVRLLAGLSRFVIADITNPRSTPLELQATVPEYMIPFVPILEDGEEPFAMFQDLWVKHRAWVLDPIAYGSVEELVQGLDEEIIEPALARFNELVKMKAEKLLVRRIGTRSTAAPFP